MSAISFLNYLNITFVWPTTLLLYKMSPYLFCTSYLESTSAWCTSQVKDTSTFSTYFCTILAQFSYVEASEEQLRVAVILITYQEQYTFAVWSWWVRYVVQRINAVFSCPSDSRLHMMSSTSLQSTFAILKKKRKLKEKALYCQRVYKRNACLLYQRKWSHKHMNKTLSPFNTQSP